MTFQHRIPKHLNDDDLMLAAQAARIVAGDMRRDEKLAADSANNPGMLSAEAYRASAEIWEDLADRLDEEDDV